MSRDTRLPESLSRFVEELQTEALRKAWPKLLLPKGRAIPFDDAIAKLLANLRAIEQNPNFSISTEGKLRLELKVQLRRDTSNGVVLAKGHK